MPAPCFAGKEVLPDGAGYSEWIRPVSNRDGEAICEAEQKFADGSTPELLDVVRIPFIEAKPSHHQQENHLICADYNWERVGRIQKKQLSELLDDSPRKLWRNYGDKNDRIPIGCMSGINHSLLLIQPQLNSLSFFTEYFDSKPKVRAEFSYNDNEYILTVTDPVAAAKYRGEPRCIATENVYLCISLGEMYRGCYWKLVAGIIGDDN